MNIHANAPDFSPYYMRGSPRGAEPEISFIYPWVTTPNRQIKYITTKNNLYDDPSKLSRAILSRSHPRGEPLIYKGKVLAA